MLFLIQIKTKILSAEILFILHQRENHLRKILLLDYNGLYPYPTCIFERIVLHKICCVLHLKSMFS